MRFTCPLAILAALAVGLAACGEKDEAEVTVPAGPRPSDATVTAKPTDRGPGGSGSKEKPDPERQIEGTVKVVVGGADPAAACSRLVTTRYVRTAYGDAQGCRAAVSGQPRFDVRVTGIEVEDPGAAAKAEPQGGPNRGETLEVRLIRDKDVWRIDYLRSNAPVGP